MNKSKKIQGSALLQDVPPELKKAVATRVCGPQDGSFCYFRIPKAANSTIVRTLACHMWDDAEKVPVSQLKRKFQNFKLLEHLTPDELLNRSFVWTFVRNPYNRVLSAYFSKIAEPRYLKRHPEIANRVTGASFSDFLRLLRDGLLLDDPHWAPQTDLLPLPPDRMHYLGRVESIDEDLPPIVERLTGRFERIHSTMIGRRGTNDLFNDHFGPEERRMAQELYRRDFELLYPDAA